ncbi:MAG TPA: Ppx/GppA phosphatase family protein [Polyangia bacterium]|nr:Ppx/GppA phosphatase family protein [Polyangia bacterium]
MGTGAAALTPVADSTTTLATIDIGTNTTLLLVARLAGAPATAGHAGPDADGGSGGGTVLAERAEITRLGRGIGTTGQLGAAGIAATLDVLRDYVAIARRHGARIAAIGTEGLRRATNADAFLIPARQILGADVEVIDGAREAALTFRAVTESFPALARAGAPLIVVDIGGGSTEIIVAERGAARLRASLPLGSVRLTERHIRADPPAAGELDAVRAAIAGELGASGLRAALSGGATTLVGVAGTVTSLAAMAQDLASYDPARVHGFALTRAALDAQIARLTRATQPEREAMPGLDPRRADVILAGALILRALVETTEASEVVVSDRGIRWGLLYEARDSEPRA